MKLFVLLILMVMGLVVSVVSYEFYTTALVNRYKFRYWFAIGCLTMFHLSLAMYQEFTGMTNFVPVRWAAFALQDLLLLEIFVYPMKTRRVELFIRMIYYYSVLMASVMDTGLYSIFNALVLMFLSWNTRSTTMHKWFTISFALYVMTTVVPEIVGYGTTGSFLIGVLFMAHLMIGVVRLYLHERVREELKHEERIS